MTEINTTQKIIFFFDHESLLSKIIRTNSQMPNMTKYIIASPFAAALLDEQQQVQQNFVPDSEHIVLS